MSARLLWVDDEIDLLKAHKIFLEKKGYEVATVSNGRDAIDLCSNESFDLVLLDESMPGLSGLETLAEIKTQQPNLPIVMVTKNEAEDLMDQAIGAQIADYLLKPVNPMQILLTLKKNIHQREIRQEVTTTGYRQEFAQISMQADEARDPEAWKELYRRIVHWELQLADNDDPALTDMLRMQKEEANLAFAKYIRKNYESWMATYAHGASAASSASPLHSSARSSVRGSGSVRGSSAATLSPSAATPSPSDTPLLSPDIFKRRVFPALNDGRHVVLIVLDNFRYDQWRVLSSELADDFDIEEDLYYSILPTSTQYARNAIFAGLMPLQIKQLYPDLWVEEEEDEGKNLNEEQLIRHQLERHYTRVRPTSSVTSPGTAPFTGSMSSVGSIPLGSTPSLGSAPPAGSVRSSCAAAIPSFTYHKLNDAQGADQLLSQFSTLRQHPLNILVINFIDILSHARTESQMVRELASNEAAYRSITLSWFRHSGIRQLFQALRDLDADIIITTDHGSIRVDAPTKVVGDRNVNTNLRYKLGRNLNYPAKEVFEMKDPQRFHLPQPNLSTAYIFALGDRFFAYPNNYNYYVQYYRNTFQHGGISMEEMIIPLVTLRPKQR